MESSDSFWKKSSKTRWWNFVKIALILSGVGFYILCYKHLDSISNRTSESKSQNKYEIQNMRTIESIGSGHVDILSLVISGVNLTVSEGVSVRIEAKKNQITIDTGMASEKPKTLESSIAKSNSTLQSPNIGNTTKQENLTDLMEKQTSFSKIMEEFDWNTYMTAVKKNDRTLLKACLEKFILEMSYFLVLPPIVPINSECKAPPVDSPEQINCSDYLTGLTGVRNNKTAKIGVFLTFGFDVDILEIHLNNMYDVADKIFITESTKSHLMTSTKPLMWEQVKHQKRFAKFAPKIVHFIVDDAQNEDVVIKTSKNPKPDVWLMEFLQEQLNWDKFLEWNKVSTFFSSDDILSFGSADEIASRKMLNVLKYCQLKDGWVDIGTWFAFGNINIAYKTDWPVRGHPYTFGAPTFRTLQSALNFHKAKGLFTGHNFRTRGKGPNFLLGGMHMTHYGYLPYQLVKRVTATEYSPFSIDEATNFSKKLTFEDIRALELHYGKPLEFSRGKLVNMTSISKDITILPWFYDCNRDRYPVWEGRHDSRLY